MVFAVVTPRYILPQAVWTVGTLANVTPLNSKSIIGLSVAAMPVTVIAFVNGSEPVQLPAVIVAL